MSDKLTFHIHRYYIKILITFFGFVSFTCCNCCLEKVYYLLLILILTKILSPFFVSVENFLELDDEILEHRNIILHRNLIRNEVVESSKIEEF